MKRETEAVSIFIKPKQRQSIIPKLKNSLGNINRLDIPQKKKKILVDSKAQQWKLSKMKHKEKKNNWGKNKQIISDFFHIVSNCLTYTQLESQTRREAEQKEYLKNMNMNMNI